MPSTHLIYFGNSNDSKYGTLRGTVAFIPLFLVLMYASYFYRTPSISMGARILAVGLAALLLCSAIGVQLPNTSSEAFLYGGLVGLVVSSCCVCFMFISTGSSMAYIAIVPLLILTASLTSLLTLKVSKRLGFYP